MSDAPPSPSATRLEATSDAGREGSARSKHGGEKQRARAGVRCAVVAADRGRGEALRAKLAELGVECELLTTPASAVAERDWLDCVLYDLEDQSGHQAVYQTAQTLAAVDAPALALIDGSDQGWRTLGLCRAQDVHITSDPAAGADLPRRLALLANRAAARREALFRAPILDSFKEPRDEAPAPRSISERPSALMLGPPSPEQVRAVDALGARVIVAHADERERARLLLAQRRFDLIVATPGAGERGARDREDAAAVIAGIDAVERPPAVLFSPHGAASAGGAPFDDVVDNAASARVAALRLGAWLALQAIKRELRAPMQQGRPHLALDGLTGLFDSAFLHAYVDERRRAPGPAALIHVEHGGLEEVNRAAGFAEGNRFLRVIGARIRTLVRAEDAPARLGGGRFAIAIHGGRSAAESLAGRIEAALRAPPTEAPSRFQPSHAPSALMIAAAELAEDDEPAALFRALRARALAARRD